MITAQHSIFDLSIVPNTSEQLRISVEVSEQSLAVALYDKSVMQFIGFESWLLPEKNSDEITATLSCSEILNVPTSEICVTILLPAFTHVPLELFDAQVAGKYLDFAVSQSFSGEVRHEELQAQQAVCVYRVPEGCIRYFEKMQRKVTYSHFSSLFISKAIAAYGSQPNTVCIFIHENSFELVAPIPGKFRLYNTYNFQSAQEFIYFLLLAVKQLGYDPETLNLNVSGGIDTDSTLMEIVCKYIRNVNPVTFTADSSLSRKLENVPKNRYDMLFQKGLNS
jgi:hypothetical protein